LSAVNVIVEFVKVSIAPVLGTPLAVKLALNQMKSPPLMGVPLKFEVFEVCAGQPGGGDDGQVNVALAKEIAIVLNVSGVLSTSVAVPDAEKVPLRGPSGFFTDALKFPMASGKT